MELTVLGMNGPFPAANGATSGYLMRGEKTRVAMDMGSGTLGRLTALMPPEKLDALLLSHWHFDHCSDVLPLLFRLQACAAKPLDVYAPVDESSMVRKVVQQNSTFCLHDVQKGDEVQIGEFSVRVFAARHPHRISGQPCSRAMAAGKHEIPPVRRPAGFPKSVPARNYLQDSICFSAAEMPESE